MIVGTCRYVNPDISHIYLAEWKNTIIPIYSYKNLISGYEWVDQWYQIKLNTARASFYQEMITNTPNGIYFNTKITITIPKTDNQNWKHLEDLLKCKKFIIIFKDGNERYFTSGYRRGLVIDDYILSENQYTIIFNELGNNLPTEIEESYVYNNIILTPSPSPSPSPSISPTPSISITPTKSVTPSVTRSPLVSPSNTPSISMSRTPSPSISMSRTPSQTISITPSISVSTTPTRALIVVENNAAIPSISNVMVNDGPISSGGFPLTYLGILTGSTSDLGSQNIDIYITYWEGGSNYIKLTDSNNVTYYSSLIGETPGGEITHIIPSIYISLSRPVRLSLEDGTPPSPSVTPSISTSITPTPSMSIGSSPSVTPSLTPSVTPSSFGPTINISNDGTYNITDVQISGITISDITFPITPSNSAVGHTTIYNNNVSVDVTLSQGSSGESITVNLNCTTTDGGSGYNFSGVDTTTGTVTISYSTGICS